MLLLLALLLAVPQAGQEPPNQGVAAAPSSPPHTDAGQNYRPPDKPKKKKKAKKNEGYSHPSIALGDHIKVSLTARVESDARMATPAIGADRASLGWEDRRVGVEGTIYDRVTFEFSREFRDDFTDTPPDSRETPWKDAYVEGRIVRAASVAAGRFKLPFGLEATTGETNLDFVNRSLASRVLAPGRDTGVMAHGRVLNKKLAYEIGYFTRDGENARTSETAGGTAAVIGRLVVAPFVGRDDSPFSSLRVGIASASSRVDNRLGLRGRTVLGDGVFFDRVYVTGQRRRLGLEASWENGPFSASTEYISLSDERNGMGFSGESLTSVQAAGWYVAGTWTVTGERKHGRVEPRRDLFRGGFGAVELAARVESLRFDDVDYPGAQFGFPTTSTLAGNGDKAVTLGVNWYVNSYVKLQGNLIREGIADPGRSPSSAADGRFASTVFRIQFRL